jgi:hypothetical protein
MKRINPRGTEIQNADTTQGSQASSRKCLSLSLCMLLMWAGPTALKQTAIQSGEKHVCYHQGNSLPFFSFEAIIAIFPFRS